jgi:RNA polymerase subunit RPABC4/transcription elongation factor Spt4
MDITPAVLIGWPGGSIESTAKLAGLIVASYLLVLWLSALVWVYRDVRSRTNDQTSQVIAVLLVALFNVPGLLVYLVIRPQSALADSYERSLESEAILHELQLAATSCHNCRRPIEDDYVVCPYCRSVLREPCRSCSRHVRTTWSACPYCAIERTPQRQMAGSLREREHAPQMPPAPTAPLQPPPRRVDPAAYSNGNGTQTPAPATPQAAQLQRTERI